MNEHAYIESKPKFTVIWIIPIIALLITVWMLFKYQADQGYTIYIKMTTAEGITAGKTEVKVRNVNVGLVKGLELDLSQNGVLAKVQIDNQYGDLLTEDAKFWVVKPRIDQSGISGMNTLLSGAYLELEPGQSQNLSYLFTLEDEPALISNDIEGKRFKLTANSAEVLDIGTSIYFRGYRIGQIEASRFDVDSLSMHYGIFIFSPYDKLITNNTIFWVSSGVDFSLDASGVQFSTGSLSKLIKGGISVDYPPEQKPSDTASANKSFALHHNYAQALEKRFDDYDYYIVEFEQSIRGLNSGAPVEYRGMRIGTVEQAPAQIEKNGEPIYFEQNNTQVPVLIKIEYGRIYKNEQLAKQYWQQNIDEWISSGLRASLKSGNLLTGAVYIDFDFYNNAAEMDFVTKTDIYPVLPSISSGFTALSEQMTALVNKLNKLPFEKTTHTLNNTLVAYQSLAEELKVMVHELNNNETADKVAKNLTQLESTLTQLTSSLKQFETTLSSYQQDSGVVDQLTNTLRELESLSNTLKPISKGFNEQPSMLIFDKNTPNDPIPEKQ
ncbi:intermembrane transport protein PqiB [Pseudoalteromonas phenolica]|uniref:intermembrane transport protein PqiB n=1 Tax=Pseudoalteromonas phenolica TaxID=161398 RepID=UPI00110B192A|nr:intermembrane transport protein PqiB [Pseudoalteromonas phenolica]TMO55646.1 mammalian cell entry protein [Pseudoalteromonas phenolica]